MLSKFRLPPAQFSQSPDGYLWANQAAAAVTEAENALWQRVDMALAGASPGAQMVFYALKRWMAQQLQAPLARFTPLVNSTTTPGLIVPATGGLYGLVATRVYGLYIRKTNVAGSALASYAKLFDDGTDSALSGLTAASRLVIPLGAVSSGNPGMLQEGMYVSPNGFPLANGIRVALVTLADTFTISAAADGGDGFIITAP
jgi:hypothetical protein